MEPHCREWLWARGEFVGVALNYACHSRRRNRERENRVADQPRQSRADAASVLVMHVGSHSGVGCCGISRELCYLREGARRDWRDAVVLDMYMCSLVGGGIAWVGLAAICVTQSTGWQEQEREGQSMALVRTLAAKKRYF